MEEASTLEQLIAAAIMALSPALIGVITWIGNTYVKNKNRAGWLIRLTDAAINLVKYGEQVLRAEIVAARLPNSPGGEKLTKEEVAEIQKKMLRAYKEFIGVKGIAEIAAVFGYGESELDKMLSRRLEGALFDLKTTKKAIEATADLPRVSFPPARG